MMNENGNHDLQRRHLVFGWRMLFLFLLLGFALETLHGLKVDWYLETNTETRRFLWTLAHAHGSLLALLNLAFAFTLQIRGGFKARAVQVVSPMLMAANILLPLGFFLGGMVVYQGDPGAGITLAPIGAVLLIIAVAIIAFSKDESQ